MAMKFDLLKWSTGALDEERVEWIPLLIVSEDRSALGLSRDGMWVVGTSSTLVLITSPRGAVWVLPVLESQPNPTIFRLTHYVACLLYTSDAADERSSVD